MTRQFGLQGSSLLLGDVSGDGILDVVGGAYQADVNGDTDVGAIYLWFGGASLGAGQIDECARLEVADADSSPGDRIGHMEWGQGLRLLDLSGDGQLDVLAGTTSASHAGLFSSGAVYLWINPSSSSQFPDAIFASPSAAHSDKLGL
jgi:hypothetical protein